jgi:hypothetical protein
MRRYLGLEVLTKSRLTRVETNAEAQAVATQEVTATAITAQSPSRITRCRPTADATLFASRSR